MKKLNESQLEDILDFENAIKKMYIRLADLEFNEKTDTDEYKIIIELLESARRIEKNKLDNIGIDEKTYDFILKFFTKDNDKTDIRYLLENQDFIEGIRLNNILNLIAMKNKAFIKEDDLKSPRYGKVLEEEFINRKYLNSYDYGVIRNTLFILSEEIKKMPDNELRKYFIYLKYLNVFIYPQIEIFFINNGCSIKSPININRNRYQVHEYTEEEYERCNRDNLIDNIINDIEYLLEGNDEDWKKYPDRLDFYRILALNKARLISVQDKSFINLIKMTTDYLIQDEEEYRVPEKEEIRLKINQMFIESLELLDTIENKRKLELK